MKQTKLPVYLIDVYKRQGEKVVVLIDEYDKPLLRTLFNDDLHNVYREMLTGFYTVLKEDVYKRQVWVSANAERHCINNGKLSYAGKYGHIWGADAERYYMGFHPTMVEAVSYTHLDVYKRQHEEEMPW